MVAFLAAVLQDSNGALARFRIRYGHSDNGDEDHGRLAVDPRGNFFLAASSYGASGAYDFALVKFNSKGEEQWTNRYDGPISGADEVRALVLDPQGSAYVAGVSPGPDSLNNFVILKYDAAGNALWTNRMPTQAGGHDFLSYLKLSNGSLVASGTSRNGSGSSDMVVVKYDLEGRMLWRTRYADTNGYSLSMSGTAVDNGGNIFVTGVTGPDSGLDVLLLKLNSQGEIQWSRVFDGGGHASDYVNGVVVDAQGNALIGGSGNVISATSADFFVVKYDREGNRLWESYASLSEQSRESARAISIDSDGNAFVTGSYTDDGFDPPQSWLTAKVAATGEVVWIRGLPADSPKQGINGRYLAVDRNDNLVVMGTTVYGTKLVRYSADGTVTLSQDYYGSELGSTATPAFDRAHALVIDESGSIFAVSSALMRITPLLPQRNYDILVLKYWEPIPPRLSAVQHLDGIRLTWPAFPDHYRLQIASFMLPEFWKEPTYEATVVEGSYSVFDSPVAPIDGNDDGGGGSFGFERRFYRLVLGRGVVVE